MAISPHPIASLTAALRTRLLGEADLAGMIGQAVYPATMRGANPPFVMIGDVSLSDNGAVESEGAVIEIELLIVTRERARLDALTIASAVEAALGDPLPVLAGHRLISLEPLRTSLRHDAAGLATQATIRLRAITEPL